jgi:hypothetical protein
MSNFRQTGSALKMKCTGQPRTATGPETVAIVRASIEQFTQCSAQKHVEAFGEFCIEISGCTPTKL